MQDDGHIRVKLFRIHPFCMNKLTNIVIDGASRSAFDLRSLGLIPSGPAPFCSFKFFKIFRISTSDAFSI